MWANASVSLIFLFLKELRVFKAKIQQFTGRRDTDAGIGTARFPAADLRSILGLNEGAGKQLMGSSGDFESRHRKVFSV
jgi:hypothetical protein